MADLKANVKSLKENVGNLETNVKSLGEPKTSNEAEVFLPPSQREPPQYPAEKPTEPVPIGALQSVSERVVVPEKPKPVPDKLDVPYQPSMGKPSKGE